MHTMSGACTTPLPIQVHLERRCRLQPYDIRRHILHRQQADLACGQRSYSVPSRRMIERSVCCLTLVRPTPLLDLRLPWTSRCYRTRCWLELHDSIFRCDCRHVAHQVEVDTRRICGLDVDGQALPRPRLPGFQHLEGGSIRSGKRSRPADGDQVD